VIVAGFDGAIAGFDRKTGDLLWKSMVYQRKGTGETNANPNATTTTITDKGADFGELKQTRAGVVFAEDWSWFYAIDPETGRTFWADHGFELIVTPESLIALTVGENWQHRVDPRTGQQIWQAKPKTHIAAASTAVVVLADESPLFHVRGLAPATGTQLWDVVSPVGQLSRIDIAAAGTDVFLLSDAGSVAALDARTGAQRWMSTDLLRPFNEDEYMSQTLAVLASSPDTLYLSDFGGRAIAISTRDGHVLWQQSVPQGAGLNGFVSDGRLIASGDRRVVAIDAKTGEVLASRNGDAVAPPAADGRTVCAIVESTPSRMAGTTSPSAKRLECMESP